MKLNFSINTAFVDDMAIHELDGNEYSSTEIVKNQEYSCVDSTSKSYA